MRGPLKRIHLISVLILTAFAAIAQQQTAGLHGILTDSTGAIIPSAKIAISSGATQRSAQSQADGSYDFKGLPEGSYKVTVSYPGFAAFEKNVTLQNSEIAQFPIQLQPAGDKQQVSVTAEAAEVSVEPEHNASATTLKGKDLDSLPDDPADLSDMLSALAGPSAGNGDAPGLLVDGFSGGQLPPKNTIKEIKINQNPFSAESEYLGFGRVEIITKPGTDSLHGNFQLTDSDAYFNSRNPFAANKADYVNRSFNETLSSSFAHKGSWTLNATQNRINNDAIIHAVTLDTNTFTSVPVDQSVITPRRNLAGTARVDYQLSTNDTATVRYTYNRNDRDNSGIGSYSLLSRAYSGEGTSHEVQATETAVVTPNLATETRLYFSRQGSWQYGDTTNPAINVDGSFNAGGNQIGNAYNIYQRFDLQNISTWVHGAHTLRFGFRWTHTSLVDNSPTNFGGAFTFQGANNVPDLDANNQPIPNTSISISSLEQYRRTLVFQKMGYSMSTIRSLGGGASFFSIAGGNPQATSADIQFEPFMQDDWRIRPNLTLSIGLRHEQQTEYTNNPVPVAPRIALAWSPHSTAAKPGKTVIRLGGGVFFDRFGPNPLMQTHRFNGTTEQSYLVTAPDFYGSIPSLSTLAAQRQPQVTWRIQPNMKPDIDKIGAVTLEQQLPRKSNASVTFLDIVGNHFPMQVNINTPLPGTYNPADPTSGVRPYGNAAGNIMEYESAGIYRQKLTMVKLETKFSKSVSLTTNYTLQFSNHDGNWMAIPSNPYNFMADYGRAGYDRRHQINLVGTIQLPGRLQFSPMFTAASGTPYDLTIGHDLNGDTYGSDRPSFATDLSRPSVVRTQFGNFDTDPIPGQTLVPHNYLMSKGMWNLNGRLGRTFAFGKAPAPAPGSNDTPEKRFKLNLNIDVNNVFNHLSPGGYVGNLSSPLFGQPTGVNLFRETSNLRRVQFGTSITF